ncbi:MAG: hypothetical protein AB7Q97_02530 [Gammaproteobacteria bacterium]
MSRVRVVKIGGSLVGSPWLVQWARALAGAAPARIVAVPGGGPFAAQVRRLQDSLGFDDRTAHRMALASMDQLGWLLTGLADGLCGCVDTQQMSQAWARGEVAVWLPSASLSRSGDPPASWTWTADALALWLACRLDAEALLLVKSAAVHAPSVRVSEMRRRGLVDAAFASRFEAFRGRAWLAHRAQIAAASALLGGNPHPPLCAILPG